MQPLANLPTPMKWALGAMGITVAGGTIAFNPSPWLVAVAVMVGLGLLCLVAWLVWRRWTKKRNQGRLVRGLQQHGAAAPRGIRDPAQRGQLDELRLEFEKGLNEFTKRKGKLDIYQLPWLLMVGAPASGKTEAIRHSEVGFPAGLRDPMQGVGGTINMHWWFTNKAVVLDTAGRLLFEEVSSLETTEWQEFLKLLRRSRPHCPINGLLLTISTDSLLKDSMEEINRKADVIARQLRTIQNTLDIRFPVFVLVTKCDLLVGFREFFDGLTDPRLQHQMFGWSNEAGLDDPFDASTIETHLETVFERLRKRRLGLLRDPAAPPAGGPKLDAVDCLYALPQSFTIITSRLRAYLDKVFEPGVWNTPLFLRGVYFTSAMREGSALDAEVAQMLRIPLDQLPAGRAWERERAFFLRDLFLEKIFRERGLVTRATRAEPLRRRRLATVYATSFAALLVFGLFTGHTYLTFTNKVGTEAAYWRAASNTNDWRAKCAMERYAVWKPIVDSGGYSWGNTKVEVESKQGERDMSLDDYHKDLLTAVSTNLNLGFFGWVSRVGVGDIQDRRRRAQQLLFEASVVRPLLSASRRKLIEDARPPQGQGLATVGPVLETLLELEFQISSKSQAASATKPKAEAAKRFFRDLGQFVFDAHSARPSNATIVRLEEIMERTYSANAGREAWPASYLSGGRSLEDNRALYHGIDALFASAQRSSDTLQKSRDELIRLRDLLDRYDTAEQTFIESFKGHPQVKTLEEAIARSERLARDLSKSKDAGVLTNNIHSLWTAHDQLGARQLEQILGGVTELTNLVEVYRSSLKQRELDQDTTDTLFQDIEKRLTNEMGKVVTAGSVFSSDQTNHIAQLDAWILADRGDGGHLFELRTEVCRFATHPIAEDLIGSKWSSWIDLTNRLHELGRLIDQHGATSPSGMTMTDWRPVLDFASTNASRQLLTDYVAQAANKLSPFAKAPLVQPSVTESDPQPPLKPEDLIGARQLFSRVSADLDASGPVVVAGDYGLDRLQAWVQAMSNLLSFMMSANGEIATCEVLLAPPDEGKPYDWANTYRNMRLKREDPAKTVRTSRQPFESVPLGRVRLDEPLVLELLEPNMAPYRLGSSVEAWGIIELLQRGLSVKGAGTNWSVTLPKPVANFTNHLRLEFRFDKPLPSLENWPKPEDWLEIAGR